MPIDDGQPMSVFDLVTGLTPVKASDVAEFADAMTNEVIPEIVKDVDERYRARRRRARTG